MTQPQKVRLLKIKRHVVGTCPECGGLGYLFRGESQVEPCRCMITFRWLMALVLARLPVATWSLDPFGSGHGDQEAIEQVREFFKAWPEDWDTLRVGLGLFGPNGTGKTTLACEVAKFALARGEKAGYLTANELLSASYPGAVEEGLLAWVESLSVCILDELDKPYVKDGSSFAPSRMDNFIRQAAVTGQLLVVVSNEVPSELGRRYGNSFRSALERSCAFVGVDGPDLSPLVQRGDIGRGDGYDGPQLQRWARLYHDATYRQFEEIL